MIVAIDGPAGSGKSTVAHLLANTQGFTYLDTGAMYRAVCVLAMQEGLDLDDETTVAALAGQYPVSFTRDDTGVQGVAIAGQDVTQAIRTPQTDANVSRVARLPRVREILVERQRELASAGDVVAEGRDTCTVVFPQAEVKVYLTAKPEARASRRVEQNRQRGEETLDEAATLQAIMRRDEIDSTRAASPLKPAEGARILDTSELTVDEVLQTILGLVEQARAASHKER